MCQRVVRLAAPVTRGADAARINDVRPAKVVEVGAVGAVLELELVRSGRTADLVPGHTDSVGAEGWAGKLVKIAHLPAGRIERMTGTVAHWTGISGGTLVKGGGGTVSKFRVDVRIPNAPRLSCRRLTLFKGELSECDFCLRVHLLRKQQRQHAQADGHRSRAVNFVHNFHFMEKPAFSPTNSTTGSTSPLRLNESYGLINVTEISHLDLMFIVQIEYFRSFSRFSSRR